jgi:diguanylate cyclase (GGDEF)-like protein/PAS domain S-box-containing protein
MLGEIVAEKSPMFFDTGNDTNGKLEAQVDIPQTILHKWQEPLDLLTALTGAGLARITLLEPPILRLLVVSNPQNDAKYTAGNILELSGGTFCASTLANEQPLFIGDASTEPRWSQSFDCNAGFKSYMGYPLRWSDNELFGTLAILSDRPAAFSDVHKRLLRQFAALIETSLTEVYNLRRNVSQTNNLLVQKKLFENLLTIARTTNAHLSLDTTLQNTIDVAVRLTGAVHGSLFLMDEKNRVTHSILARGNPVTDEKRLVINVVMERGAAGWVMRNNQTALIADTLTDERWFNFPNQPYRVRSALILPISRGARLMGIMSLHHSQPGHFSHDHARLMQAAADQMALALENARLYHAIQQELVERRKAELQLRESEARYRAVSELTSDYTFALHYDFKTAGLTVEWITDAFTRVTGYTARDLEEWGNWLRLVHEEDLPLAHTFIQKVGAGQLGVTELRIMTRQNEVRWIRLYAKPETVEGEPHKLRVLGAGQDITERKKVEEALQLANQQLRGWVNELEQHSQEITMLNEMSDLFRVCRTAAEAYDVVSQITPRLFPAESGALYIINREHGLVEAVSQWGKCNVSQFSPEDCWALRRGRVHLIENSHDGLLCQHFEEDFNGSYICVPMMAQGETLGVFHLHYHGSTPLPESHRRLAVTVAEHIALALANLRLQETLRSQSIRDPLTGLYNRRYMQEALEREVAQAQRNGTNLSLVMFDLDHFKRFNDMFGHDAGDLVLRELGQLLQDYIGGKNIACRYGGEEFILILPETTLEQAQEQATVIAQAIHRLKIVYKQRTLGALTVSQGISYYPGHGKTLEEVMLAADAALYQAKQAGRDRIVIWDNSLSSPIFDD